MHLVDAPTLLSRLSHFSPVLINILPKRDGKILQSLQNNFLKKLITECDQMVFGFLFREAKLMSGIAIS